MSDPLAPPDRPERRPQVRDMGESTEYGDRICEFCNQQVPARHRCVDVAVPARAHQEETTEEKDDVSRVDGERLSDGQELPRKPPTGCL